MATRYLEILFSFICLYLVTACTVIRDEKADQGPSRFAKVTAVPYFTSAPYDRWPGKAYPNDPAEYYLRRVAGLKLAADGNCEAAVPELSRLVEQYTDDSKLWVYLGLCQGTLGKTATAVESLKTAIELGSTMFDGRFEALPTELMVKIGWLYAKAGDTDHALAWIRRSLEARNANRPSLARQPEAGMLKGNPAFAELAGLPPDTPLSRDEKWRYDIRFFADQIAMLHYDPDQHTPAQDLEREFRDLQDDVPQLSDEQIVMRLQLIMGMLGAGHDVLFIGSARYGAAKAFALRLYLFTDGLYVIDAEDTSLIGSRVDAFGSTPVDSALRSVGQAMGRDNNQTVRWGGPNILTFPVLLQTLGIVEDAETATLTLTDRSGIHRIVRPALGAPHSNSPALTAPHDVKAPLYLSRLKDLYWTQRLPEINSLYVQVNGISNALNGESFSEFSHRLQQEIADPAVRNVILDLRHNLGGTDFYSNQLLRVLVHFDMEPGKGKLFVIIGRNTFSAAQIFITRLEPLCDAVFVGEPSGSRPNFIGRTGQFTLPYSGLSGFLSSELSMSSAPEDHRIWIAPDMPVALTSTEFFAGRDPALDAIEHLLSISG